MRDFIFILCSIRLPTVTGAYKILNNSSCNNGEGQLDFIVGDGWQIPEVLKDFYQVIAWMEEEGNDKV